VDEKACHRRPVHWPQLGSGFACRTRTSLAAYTVYPLGVTVPEPPFRIQSATIVNMEIADFVASQPRRSCALLFADVTGMPTGAYLDDAHHLLNDDGCFVRLCHRANGIVASAQLRDQLTEAVEVGYVVRTHTRGQRFTGHRRPGLIQPAYLDRVLREEVTGTGSVLGLTSCGGLLPAAAYARCQELVCTEPDRDEFICATVNFARTAKFPATRATPTS